MLLLQDRNAIPKRINTVTINNCVGVTFTWIFPTAQGCLPNRLPGEGTYPEGTLNLKAALQLPCWSYSLTPALLGCQHFPQTCPSVLEFLLQAAFPALTSFQAEKLAGWRSVLAKHLWFMLACLRWPELWIITTHMTNRRRMSVEYKLNNSQ